MLVVRASLFRASVTDPSPLDKAQANRSFRQTSHPQRPLRAYRGSPDCVSPGLLEYTGNGAAGQRKLLPYVELPHTLNKPIDTLTGEDHQRLHAGAETIRGWRESSRDSSSTARRERGFDRKRSGSKRRPV